MIGHVCVIVFTCPAGHTVRWSSSEKMGSNYVVNYKMMQAYLCSGITPIQYERLSDFADYGMLSPRFRSQAQLPLSAIISFMKRASVFQARAEEMRLTGNGKKISIMTDAWHGCRKNSVHTDHVAIGCRSHKVVDIQHVSKKDDLVSQRHETLGVRRMYDEFDRQNITVDIHVHDNNASINKAIREKSSGICNCNERWHATKPITAGMKAISIGAKKREGITWHAQLRDKGARLRNHAYWALGNCNNDPSILRQHLDNSVLHFQDIHDGCDTDSECKEQGYVPDFTIVRDHVAVQLLREFIKSLTLYKMAGNFVLNMDTYYVESFNNTCLIYLDKRIHYKDVMYELRSDLSVICWNEHVDRPYTSTNRLCVQIAHGDFLVKKRIRKKPIILSAKCGTFYAKI